MTEDTRC